MSRKWTAALLCLSLTLGLALGGCAPSAAKQSRSGFYFDTVISMTVYTNDEKLLDDAQAECQRYDDLLSKTKVGSDVWNINHANGERVAVSEDTRDIIEKALEYSRLSEGRFDITIEPCVALWDFTGDAMGILPDGDALAAAAAKVDWTQVDVSDGGVRIPAGMTIDLGAIAKGYITDRIADFLKDRGVKNGFLNFGGNVLTIGGKPDGTAWNIGVQDPQGTQSQGILGVVAVEGEAVVTSGIYERGFDVDGVRYHHILDPETGWPVQNELAGVSIVAEDAFDADALSTTVFAMGLEAGTAFIEGLDGIEAVFVTRDDAVTWTSGLEGRFTLQEQ
ncbi:FAD:protein FMN transferase [Pseudoflavonifractor sp. BIOML-A6]|nr:MULTISPECIES: FAD:protein FMN transferase [unclassified Pseudoflavonifractor]MTQ95445.1 FAD:protein FMN transferase [Pseudoflavonifractor sp. BIOML-A16]MTR07608.1 FAD:protein FMN transferase [Pseudoflavonifractor sp. BIOML-A15]MTR33639.1 FAD:protein FMN transferase [Pseudoflavonifractor sp. BIOML-A14]MTR74482.1 FAD:protein FMN transferase [Pseudoflavonifractor sp. BIOML-A18]MTS65673.1 FAD:protein FMN transferase [Pseudoflavonifractor sp. BIOML-A5]MTS73249.1 FAD:protein FMN transferase [Pse